MKTIESNKMIAEFMGCKLIESDFRSQDKAVYVIDEHDTTVSLQPDGGDEFSPDEMGYHRSWDWLMPVVEKIESMSEKVTIQEYNCEIDSRRVEIFVVGKSKKHGVYKAAVDYIIAYNKNQGWK